MAADPKSSPARGMRGLIAQLRQLDEYHSSKRAELLKQAIDLQQRKVRVWGQTAVGALARTSLAGLVVGD